MGKGEKERKMRVELFGKKMTTRDGKKTFYNYFGKITKAGELITVTVKFKENCKLPSTVPCVIEFDKKNASLSEKMEKYKEHNDLTMEDTEKEVLRRTLWIGDYTESEYIDTSLDDVE